MKKTITTYCFLLFALLMSFPSAFGQKISLEEAQQVAKNVFKSNTITATTSSLRAAKIANHYTKEQNGQVAYYAFNFQPTGFVIIAADDRYYPILAFSNESHFNLDNPATTIGLEGTLSKHTQRIAYIKDKNLSATRSIQREWKQLKSGQPISTSRSSNVVGPLTTTRWNQGEFYNAQCPASDETLGVGPADRTYCGCVPVSMAQLIKYHNFPERGNGTNQYVDENFGMQSADFCATTYNWGNMPDVLTEPNADVAQLIYQMGIASNTQYSVSYTETYFSYVRDAFVNYFGYNHAARWFYDANYDRFAEVAKEDLDRGFPLLLTGTSKTFIGHSWVADGYGSFGSNETADYFHFNWGWGGSNNGWFLDSGESWKPLDGQGEGVQEIVYYWDRYVLHNLYPADASCQTPPSYNVFPQGIQDNYSYLHLYNPVLDQEINFRYREAGNSQWINTDVTTDYFQLIRNLKPGTQYEFQGRTKCCSDIWSDYSTLQTFTTTGTPSTGPEPPTSTCLPLTADQLTSGSITGNFAYIYTTLPYGQVNNRFRYRIQGTSSWTTLAASTSHFRSLSDLTAGTTYEFQVTHECSEGEWSGYSEIQTFSTEGLITCTAVFFADLDGDGFGDENNTISGCSPPAGYVNNFEDCDDSNPNIPTTPGSTCEGGVIGEDGCTCNANSQSGCAPVTGNLFTTSLSDHNTYIYTPQPLGAVNNQFRYRPIDASTWNMTNIATLHYRYLRDLLAGTAYEFQVRQQCEDGTYSDYSASSYFTTTGTAEGNGNNGNGNNGNGNNGNGNNGNGNNGNGNNGNGNNGNGNGNNGNGNNGNCSNVSSDQLFISGLGTSATYIYTPQPNGATNNQFRYRPVGAANWALTDISTLYYRYISGLAASTQYEYQVRHECETNVWSDYSDSYTFTTAASFQSGGTTIPMDYATFRQLTTAQNIIQLEIAPNPVFNELILQVNQPADQSTRTRIYSIEGQLVKELTLQAAQQRATIAVQDLQAGIYLLEYQTATSQQTVKFVKR